MRAVSTSHSVIDCNDLCLDKIFHMNEEKKNIRSNGDMHPKINSLSH